MIDIFIVRMPSEKRSNQADSDHHITHGDKTIREDGEHCPRFFKTAQVRHRQQGNKQQTPGNQIFKVQRQPAGQSGMPPRFCTPEAMDTETVST